MSLTSNPKPNLIRHSIRNLILIVLGALALRLVLLVFVHHPGISDPNHYYNIGVNLATGRGYIIDYIWQYNNPPDAVTHPDDYRTPLTGVLAALPMAVAGVGVPQSLALFILMGALLPLVGYAASRQFGLSEGSSLFVAAACAFLPEFVLNSLRTDTTIPNALLVCTTILLLTHGLQTGRWWAFAGSGVAAGLAYLNRNDGSLLLPMYVVTLITYLLWGRHELAPRWRYVAVTPVVAFVIFTPWLARNLEYSGSVATPNMDRMFYLTDYRDHYRYEGVFNLQTLFERQTPAQLVGKRLFEGAASIKLMYTTLDVFLPVAVAGGLLLLVAARNQDRRRLLTLSPTLILLFGYFVFYTVLVPFKSQGGSFKKDYLTLIPLLLPLAGYALERAISDTRIRTGTMALATAFLVANAVELVRADARATDNYLGRINQMKAVAETLPDTNGDGEIVLMTQDPFMLSFVEIPSILFPSDEREIVLDVAERYRVDYLLMPPDRPALDALYLRTETDPRFFEVAPVPGTEYSFYGIDPDAEPAVSSAADPA